VDPEVQTALQGAGATDSLSVIVTFSNKVDTRQFRSGPRAGRRAQMVRALRSRAAQNQKAARNWLAGRKTGRLRSLWLINGLEVNASRETIQTLAGLPQVDRIRLNRTFSLPVALQAPSAPPEWNLSAIRADALWALGHAGQGMVVATMDSGVDLNHPDLVGRWRGGTNSWYDPYATHPLPADPASSPDGGHGTGVMGILVGGDAGGTTIGVAPGAKWISVKIFDDNGSSDLAKVHLGFQWLLDPDGDPDTDDAPDIVNNSWGLAANASDFDQCAGDPAYDEFDPDIQALRAAGIAVVFAGGNFGPNSRTSVSPANVQGAVAVGFVNQSQTIANASSRGPSGCGLTYPAVVAPGEGVLTADLSFGGLPGQYVALSGSSFAAPHASGALALLAGAFPGATLADLERALTTQALDLGAPGPDDDYGNGLVDTKAAYDYLETTTGLTPCVRPDIHFDAAPFPGVIGQPVTFTATVAGGTGPFSYAWDVDADGVDDYIGAAVISHTYTSQYTGSVVLTVTDDATGCTSQLVIANNWAVNCPAITAGITVTPNPAVVGQAVAFSSTVAGGNGPYVYEWDLDGDGFTDCTGADCTNTYTAAFSGNVRLMVTDSLSCTLPAAVLQPLVVNAAPGSGASGGAPSGGGGGGGGGCFLNALWERERP